jgi:small subunit ribosomal protein S6
MHPRRYETLILLAPGLETLEAFKTKVEGILEAGGGQLVRFEDWGRRRLAYPVQKELYGHYLLYDYQGGPALAAELERNLKIDEKVFKYLTLVLAKKFTAEDLAAAREKIQAEAARRESEKARREEAETEDDGAVEDGETETEGDGGEEAEAADGDEE